MFSIRQICCLILLIYGSTEAFKIQEPESYEPKIIPNNVQNARALLGYDNIKLLPKNPNQSNNRKKYAWEIESSEVKYNFGLRQ